MFRDAQELDVNHRFVQGQKMKITITKIVSFVGKAVAFILITLFVILLIAERFQETSFVNFIRSLM